MAYLFKPSNSNVNNGSCYKLVNLLKNTVYLLRSSNSNFKLSDPVSHSEICTKMQQERHRLPAQTLTRQRQTNRSCIKLVTLYKNTRRVRYTSLIHGKISCNVLLNAQRAKHGQRPEHGQRPNEFGRTLPSWAVAQLRKLTERQP